MSNIEKEDGLYTDFGQKLRGNIMGLDDIIVRLSTMEGSKTAKDAIQWMERTKRLLTPIWMTLAQNAMADQAAPDEAILFTFSGSGGSDFTFVAEWRALFGDERNILKEMEKDFVREHHIEPESDIDFSNFSEGGLEGDPIGDAHKSDGDT